MSGRLASHAEVLKLVRLLGSEPDAFPYLSDLPASELRELRELATDAVFAEVGGGATRLAVASKPLPSAAVARIGRALGPELCAMVASAIEPDRAVEVAGHLPGHFLAEIAIHIDPRRAREVIARQPPKLVGEVTPILVERKEWVTMGRFLGALAPAAIEAAVDGMSGEALIRTGLVTEDTERLSAVVALLGDQQLEGMVEAAAEHDLWPEALSLLDHFDRGALERFAALPIASEQRVLERVVTVATAEGQWLQMLPFVGLLPEKGVETVAGLVAGLDEQILLDSLALAGEHDLWQPMLTIVAQMDESGIERVAQLIGEVSEAELYSLVGAIVERDLFREVLTIAGQVPEPHFTTIARHLVEIGAEPLTPAIVAAANETGLWKEGLELLTAVGPELQQQLVEPVSALSEADRSTIAEQAEGFGLFGQLGPLRPVLGRAPGD